MKLLGGLAKGKIAEPSELGSWYANNITGNASAMLFSTVLYGLVPLSFGFTVFIPAPLDFPALLDFTWMALPIFLAIGFVAGIDVRNRWLDVVDPEPDDEKDAS